MSLFPIDLPSYKSWTVRQLYNLLKPYLLDDFVTRSDFEMFHTPGNLLAPGGSGGPVTYTAIQPSSTIMAAAQRAEAQVAVQEGRVVIETAQSTGEFTGA